MRFSAIAFVAGVAVSAASAQQYVIGVDSTANAAHLFNPFDGSIVQDNFLQWGDLGTGGSTAKEALQVGDQIWVSDQLRDVIYRFGLDGAHLGTIGNSGLDNIRGMEVVGDQVWVTNAGSNQGAPGNSLVFIDIATTSIVGSAAANGSTWDIINYNGQLLVSDSTSENLEIYDLSGNFVSVFHDSDGLSGIDFPQQMFAKANGNVLAAGFSLPSGVYEYDSMGNSLGIVAGDGFGPRGVLQLGNGEIMWTNGAGFWVSGGNVFGGSGQYLNFVTIPTPAGLALLAMGGAVATRRRR
jgi:hypothetical protein